MRELSGLCGFPMTSNVSANVINDTLSGDARLRSFKITSHGVKSKYLGFLGLLLQLLFVCVVTQNTKTFSHLVA